jgi:hypothetical protein
MEGQAQRYPELAMTHHGSFIHERAGKRVAAFRYSAAAIYLARLKLLWR